MTPARTSNPIEAAQEALAAYRAQVDVALAERLPEATASPTRVHQAMRHATLNGGKRIRPACTLASAVLLGADAESLLDAACAVEFAHAASLVLDDLPCMDDAKTRRGARCTHLEFDTATALLAAMALLSRSFRLVARNADHLGAPERADAAVALLDQAIGSDGLIHGQALDLEYTHRAVPLDLLERIHDLKAGALFVASVQLPVVLLGRSQAEREALGTYARNIGLAFQITDDLLDEAQPEEDFGKSTFTTHLGRDGAIQRVNALVDEAAAALDRFDGSTEILIGLAHYVKHRNA